MTTNSIRLKSAYEQQDRFLVGKKEKNYHHTVEQINLANTFSY